MYHLVACCAHGFDDVVIIFAVRCAEKRAAFAGNGLKFIVHFFEFVFYLSRAQRIHMGVRIAVVADFVPFFGYLFDLVGIFIDPHADKKERGLNVLLLKFGQYFGRFIRFPCCVYCKRNLFIAALDRVYRQLAVSRGGKLDLVFIIGQRGRCARVIFRSDCYKTYYQ
ncbi:hypothetical protein SDC9_188240 [bioreactor metagenome]|uniref:Uncharacterized protein n=1 Tax=bioreactor metagenome TaxID=1076179 RepID=A0A645HNT1_9ZZZZ